MVKVIKGSYHLDNRGILVFNNNFNFKNIHRSYLVQNKDCNTIRAWHAHKIENKYFLIIKGAFQISAVKIDNYKNPSKKLKPKNFFLKEQTGDILHIPGGFANGFKALYPGSIIQIFSNSHLAKSLKDDFRYEYDYWNAWDEKNY